MPEGRGDGDYVLGAIHILRKKNSGWVGLQNAYNCLFTLCNQAHFCIILLIMWVGGLKNRENVLT